MLKTLHLIKVTASSENEREVLLGLKSDCIVVQFKSRAPVGLLVMKYGTRIIVLRLS